MSNEEIKEIEIEEEDGISLGEIWMHIKRHMIAIIAIVIIFMAGGVAFNAIKAPEYESSASLMVQYESDSGNLNNDLTFSNKIANTYVEFAKNDLVLKPVSEEFKIELKSLKENLSIRTSKDSLILEVNYVSEDKEQAQKVVNAVIDSLFKIISEKDDQGKPVYSMLYDNLKVLSPAEEALKVSKAVKYIAIFTLLGLVVAGGYVLVRILTDKRFKSNEEIEKVLNLPVLAGIPAYELDNNKKGRR